MMMYYYRRKTSKIKIIIVLILIALIGGFGYWFYANYFSKIDFARPEPKLADNLAANQGNTKILLGNIYVMQGQVEMAKAESGYAQAVNETILHQGDKIKTGTDGLAIIKLEDGSFIRLNNNTEVILTDLKADNVTISQLDGRTYCLTKNQQNFTLKSGELTVKASKNIFELIVNKAAKSLAVLNFVNNLQAEVSDDQGLLIATRLIAEEKGLFDLKADKNSLLKIEKFKKTDLAKETWYEWNFALDEKVDQPIIVPVEEPEFSVTSETLQISGELKDNRVNLAWTVYNKEDFKKYQLVKSESNQDLKYPDDNSIKSGTSVSLAAYQDAQVEPGKKYYYRLCVIKINDKIVCGNVINLEIPKEDEPDTTAPAAPNLSISISAEGVNLTWPANKDEDFEAYKILRSITKASPAYNADIFKTISDKGQSGYLDNSVNITSVGNYYYRICAVDKAGNYACSGSRMIENGQVK